MAKIKLSIIIINYNGEEYLKSCIESIYSNCNSITFEIIIFDNNSIDNSADLIGQYFSEVKFIKHDKNIGFAKGNNKAVKSAKGEFILLLNNDTILTEDLFGIIKILEKNNNIGALGIKMLDKKKNYAPSAGKFPKPFKLWRISNLNYRSNEFKTGKFKDDNFFKVDWVSGAFLLTKKSYWDKVKGLDEDYFMYVEDVDYCKKLTYINKITVFVPSISFIHFIGFNAKREARLIKGYFLYASKHFNKFEELIAKLCLYSNYAFKKAFKSIH